VATRPSDTGCPSDLVCVRVPDEDARARWIKVKPRNDGDSGVESQWTRYVDWNRVAPMGFDRPAVPRCEGQREVSLTPACKGQREAVAGPQFSFGTKPGDGHSRTAQTGHMGIHPDYRKWEAAVVLNSERHTGPTGWTGRGVGRIEIKRQLRPQQAAATHEDDNDGDKDSGNRQQEGSPEASRRGNQKIDGIGIDRPRCLGDLRQCHVCHTVLTQWDSQSQW
jgi:hypothetical protein